MISASSLAFPGTKTVAGWWRQLAPFRPAAIWVGHLFVHRLEALAEVVHFETVDALQLLLLKTLALQKQAAVSDLLPFAPDIVNRLLGELCAEGLIRKEEGGRMKDEGIQTDSSFILHPSSFSLSDLGRIALETGQYPRPRWQRREFVFAERLLPDGQRSQPPLFLPLLGNSGTAWQPEEGTRFNLAWLRDCLDQPALWKERLGFPGDVRSIADPAAPISEAPGSPPAWQRVLIDRPERLLIAMIQVEPTGNNAEHLLAFSAKQEGWELNSEQPLWDLPGPARQDLPEFAQTFAKWAKVWQAWCQVRKLPVDEVAECVLKASGCKLAIQVPDSLHNRLAAAKSDLLKGESWLVADEGYMRSAVQVQIVRSLQLSADAR